LELAILISDFILSGFHSSSAACYKRSNEKIVQYIVHPRLSLRVMIDKSAIEEKVLGGLVVEPTLTKRIIDIDEIMRAKVISVN
jgi:hypothetical protein